VVIVALVAFVATRPDTFHVERSATFAAPADVAFGLVNDFHSWSAWSPWEKLDPAMKKSFEGPASGVGAIYRWTGNDQVGEGSMTITAARPAQAVEIQLEFLKPFAAKNDTLFTFKPTGDQTTVTWAMNGNNNFMAKAIHVVMDMDKMIGKDFESGLGTLKTLAEAEARKRAESAKAAATPAPAPADAPHAPDTGKP